MPLSARPLPPEGEQLRIDVLNWLSAIPKPPSSATVQSSNEPNLDAAATLLHYHKRRRSPSSSSTGSICVPLTAAATTERGHSLDNWGDMSAPARIPPLSPKKRKVDDGRTPPAASSQMGPPPLRVFNTSSPIGSRRQSIASSPVSSQSSKKKQMANLEASGLVTTQLLRLEHRGLPPQLKVMLNTLIKVYTGVGVISEAHQVYLNKEKDRNDAFHSIHSWNFAPAAERDTIGPTPSATDVRAIYSWAKHIELIRAGEDTWNTHVHSRLLDLAVHGGAEHKEQLLDVQTCTSTPIIQDYLPPRTTTKKIDFVLVINPWNDSSSVSPTAEERVNQLRAILPELSINHCDHYALLKRPVAVSIETKKTSSDELEAELQIGTWLAAQWKLLEYLVAQASNGGGGYSADAGAGERFSAELAMEEYEAAEPADLDPSAPSLDDRLKELPFLPAIIVQGHNWSFVAATREGPKITLWTGCPFGSTKDVVNIYKVVAGIQHIARYADGTFWPWYKDAVLGMGPQGE